jgi:hypothetical protein
MDDEANAELWPEGQIETEIRVKRSITKKVRKIWQRAIELSRPMTREHDAMLMCRAIDPSKVLYGSAWSGLWLALVQEFSFEEVEAAGLVYRRDDGITRCCKCILPGRLLIAYPGNAELVPFLAGYARCPERGEREDEEAYEKRKGDWKKCCGPNNFPSQIYGIVPQYCPLLIITEGQLKAEAAIQAGFPCVGLPGISAQHKPLTTKCKNAEVKRAVILFDSQAENQAAVDLQASNLARELLKAKIPTYRAILPLEGEKSDIDSFLADHKTEEFENVLREAAGCPYRFSDKED